jgi:hypothetical protein
MTARPLRNPAASIRARLLAHAKQHNDVFERILTRYAIERLLFRLGQTETAERYVLKGAMLFVTWPEHVFRPTGDLDLLGEGNPDPAAVAELFTRICQVEVPDDGIVFDPDTLKVDAVREADRYQGVQLSLKGNLAGAIIHVQVDIGFGDHVYPAPTRQTFPSLLPDLPAANILMYPPETVVAEKFEAFHDIWVTTRTFPFELAGLVEAIGGTMKRRQTAIPTELPVSLTEAFAKIAEDRGLWTGFLRRNPPTLPPPPFPELQDALRRFFRPVIAGLAAPESARGGWDPDAGVWR